jgi:signal peptidase II
VKFRPAVWLVAALVAGIDQAVKFWASHALHDGHSIPILGSTLRLTLVYNEGAALSVLGHQTIVITAIMIAIALMLIWFHGRANGLLGVLVIGAALGGAFGNLWDRFTVGYGGGRGPVIDMIAYGNFFIGNVADIAIVLAAGATIVASWTNHSVLLPRAKAESAAAVEEKPGAAKAADEKARGSKA